MLNLMGSELRVLELCSDFGLVSSNQSTAFKLHEMIGCVTLLSSRWIYSNCSCIIPCQLGMFDTQEK